MPDQILRLLCAFDQLRVCNCCADGMRFSSAEAQGDRKADLDTLGDLMPGRDGFECHNNPPDVQRMVPKRHFLEFRQFKEVNRA